MGLVCTETGERTYITQKNKINSNEKIQLKKYNPKLRKHTVYKEVQRLH